MGTLVITRGFAGALLAALLSAPILLSVAMAAEEKSRPRDESSLENSSGSSSGAATADEACLMANAAESDFPNSLVVNAVGEVDGIVAAWYDGATRRYRHGVLGDDIEAGELHVITNRGGEQCGQRLILEMNEVFEDLAPRLVDMDQDGNPDIVAIVSDSRLGARLAVFGHKQGSTEDFGLKAATPNIGTRNRWLAPVGTGDFNSDGKMDVAFIDRPHLAKILRVFSYDIETGLNQIAFAQGYTNHRIGEDFISSGVRSCDGQLQLITVDSTWDRILATTVVGTSLNSEDAGAFDGIESLKAALACPD